MKSLKIIFVLPAIAYLSIPKNAQASGGASSEPCGAGYGTWTYPEGEYACGIIPTRTSAIVRYHPSLEETEFICSVTSLLENCIYSFAL